jgi:hypothetical protein
MECGGLVASNRATNTSPFTLMFWFKTELPSIKVLRVSK